MNMNYMSVSKTGYVFGGLFGVIHLVWAVLVAVGVAQPLLDFVFKLHMLQPVVVVGSFNLMYAVGLIVMTAVVGYIVGVLLAAMWNYAHGE